jgi:hypothetical protein
MESFSVRTTLNQGDWHALMAAARERMTNAVRDKGSLVSRHAPKLLWLGLVAVLVFMMNTRPPLVQPLGLLLAGLSIGCAIWLVFVQQRRATAPDDQGAFLGDGQLEFEATGFQWRRANSDTFNRWPLVKEITHSADHIFLWIDSCSGYVLPVRDLPAPLTVATAVSRLKEFMTTAASEVDSVLPAASTTGPALVSPITELETTTPLRPPSVPRELAALLRLHTWRTVGEMSLYGRDITIILLGVFCFALWAGLDRLDYGDDVEISWYTLAETGVVVLAVLMSGWLCSRLSRPRVEFRRSLLLLLGFLPLFVAGFWLAMKLPKTAALVSFMVLIGAADVYLVTGMRSLTGKRQELAVISVLAFTLLLLYLSVRFDIPAGIWYEPEP